MSIKSFAFGHESRITTKQAYSRVFAKPGFTKKNNFFSILAVRGQVAPVAERGRLGIVVSKKSVRLAVRRNRVKRFLREAFRLHQADWFGWDVVVVVRRDFIVEKPGVDWSKEIFTRVDKARVASRC